ncbi:transcriptional regulator, GntR family [Parvibaculum lavamentivorans DS-1]|uniref:Transcriptional regulator, GntR family n=1 Tax=Parvibaculum lavamentivorans (strain DS-1 / DSM 13023 / NCIMB 13966) TaxID=402881 RepID=A7HQH5_PARL1|nr:GntR family transcriptional regulator [Parvibaculum lavamentivorans]ABS62158.1 transcriptional regulator, GntR family [Parvibaculum lavamentivorans DS-1]
MTNMPAKEEAAREEATADPQHTEPATHSVLMRLREMIVTGRIPPETKLRAEALAAQLNVSRTPIRSALAVLSAEGLVNYSVNRGYTVRAVTIGDVLDSIEVRASLEGMAARTAVDRGWEPGALEQLAGLVAQSRAIVDRGKWSEEIEREWYQLNWHFHRSIMIASRNDVLRNSMRMTVIYPVLGDAARLCPSVAACVAPRHRQVPATPPAHIVDSQKEHENLLAAIRREDSAEAQRLMSDHVLATKKRLLAIAIHR